MGIFEPCFHIYKSFYPSKIVFYSRVIRFQKNTAAKKTDGKKWAHNNFANGWAEELAVSPGVRCYNVKIKVK